MKPLETGDSYSLQHTFTAEQVQSFADLTGDDNPIHVDPTYVEGTRFEANIVHGMFLASLISRVLGRHFPGEGTIYVKQELEFTAPVFVHDTVTVTVSIRERLEKGRARLDTVVTRSDGTTAVTGEALIIVPRGR
jgi:3-hydroxybutyryl-CoA dehydratase